MSCAMRMEKLPPVTTNQWKTIFPDFTTFTGSCLFIKKLIAVSLSTVTYIRGIFPEKAYGERDFCGIKLKLLTEDSEIVSVNQFINLVRNCYEAVDKKYLQQLSIGICRDPENREEVLESYNMNFRYREDDFSVANNSSSRKLNPDDPTVEATLWLLKSILAISDLLDPLPKEAFITMKLLYNDEITPPNYEPVGFEPSNSQKFTFPSPAVKLELGKVVTDMHGYKMFLKTALSRKHVSLRYEEVLAESQRQNYEEALDNSQRSGYMMDIQQSGIFPTDSPEQVKIQRPVQSGFVEVSPVVREDEEEIECICNCKQDSGTDIFACSVCGIKQHSVCYGILEKDETESGFYCVHCFSEAAVKGPQRDLIYVYEGDEQIELGAFRRALVFCESQKHVTVLQLERGLKCKKQLARELIERLEFEGFIRKSGNKYIVNGNKITHSGYQEYFSRMRETGKTGHSQNVSKKANICYPVYVEEENTRGTQRGERSKRRSSRRLSKTPPSRGTPSEDPLLSEDDGDIHSAVEKEVQKLNLRESSTSEREISNSGRRSLKEITGNAESDVSRPASKRRCLKAKKVIELEK